MKQLGDKLVNSPICDSMHVMNQNFKHKRDNKNMALYD